MIKKKLVEVPAKTEEREVAVICDSCSKESTQREGWAGGYNIDEITISRNTGSSYPEGGSGEKFVVDLCPDCFKDKLLPALNALGIYGRTDEWDW